MKKVLFCVVTICVCLSFASCCFADENNNPPTAAYTTVSIPFPDNIDDMDLWYTCARYKDTKEPITLSAAYQDSVYATIPIRNIDREIEAYVPNKIEFSDYSEASSGEFFDMEWMSKTGVIKGNENGEARPYENITRAEAAAMIMRVIGLENMPEANGVIRFEDVSINDWFYSAVMSAYKCGIIEGISNGFFEPYRAVTREEITVMTARALKYAGLRCSKSDMSGVADTEKISDWAKEAYDYIGGNFISEYNYEQTSGDDIAILVPQKAAKRHEAASMLMRVSGNCQVYPSEEAVNYGFDEKMPVIDGSTSTYPFTQAVYHALFYNGETHEQFPEKHSKSHESYQRLINGEVDMLFASVYPASDILALAAEKGVELELIPMAYDAMVFFTNKDNPASGLTQEQISDIYVNNAYDNWSEIGGSDALLYPYCRNNDSGSHAQMEKHFLNGHEINAEVQQETSETMASILTDVMAAKTDDPIGYGLGYSIYYYYHNMFYYYPVEQELKLLAVDGVMPTDETIADGTYPLSNNTYIVLRKDTPEDAPSRRMAEFMLTDSGQQCVEHAGFGRLR